VKDPAGFSIETRAGSLAAIGTIVRHFHPNEIGGILVGYRFTDSIVVEDFLYLPNVAVPTAFERLHSAAEISLATYLQLVGDQPGLGYIGEWHSHPSCHSASTQDLSEIADLAVNTGALLGLVVIGADPDRIEAYPYLCDENGFPWPTRLHLVEDGINGRVVRDFGYDLR
jgi:proteasome lid subunit RPN8/RPN11